MSLAAEAIALDADIKRDSSWSLWLRQIAAIMRIDVKRNFFGKRSVLIYLVALMPIGLLGLIAILPTPGRDWLDFTAYPKIFSVIYGGLIPPPLIFFGLAPTFMNPFPPAIIHPPPPFPFLSPVS